MEQYRLENRRRTELSEFKAREEKRKKKEGQRSNSSSSSSSSSYDEGSDGCHILVIMMRIVTITMKIIVMV